MIQTATPGFQALPPTQMVGFVGRVARDLPRQPGQEPSMVIGSPEAKKARLEDGGRTLVVPFRGKQTVYAKRDDYPQGPVVTFLLASEY